ncbi:MAG: uncharacterized 2Fe-2S/4Fe-4S cluster protein (DUF4445 family), partial [Planctomycetota bacterium]
GQGKCRECWLEVDTGAELLSPRADEERSIVDALRLACRAKIVGTDGELNCRSLHRGQMRIVTEAAQTTPAGDHYAIEASVRRVDGQLQQWRRSDSITADATAEPEQASGDHIWFDLEPGLHDGDRPLLGLAVDLGTTTIAIRLHDLSDGRLLATRALENPQRFGGSDVMARIRFDGDNKGKLLRRTLLGYLSHAIEELPCESENIFEIVVCGNTTMRDLLFGLSVQPIGQFPYWSQTESEWREGRSAGTTLSRQTRSMRLPSNSAATIYSPPLISGHVGSDAATAMLATGLLDEAGTVVMMDIGTNSELIVAHEGKLWAASCPAGPAFEGGAIQCGMPALDGAIESFRFDDAGGRVMSVIGGGSATGICGSALVDLMSELLRTDRMNERGRLTLEDESEGIEEDGLSFIVDEARGLHIAEADIGELAQAKGANAAGLSIVMEMIGLRAEDIDRFYLAGGFARHIDLDAARRIGLIPDLSDDRLERIGNAALQGASIALTSLPARMALELRAQQVEHISLETHPDFFEHFVQACQFTPMSFGS